MNKTDIIAALRAEAAIATQAADLLEGGSAAPPFAYRPATFAVPENPSATPKNPEAKKRGRPAKNVIPPLGQPETTGNRLSDETPKKKRGRPSKKSQMEAAAAEEATG